MGRGSGGVLLSRRAAPQVSWELEGLTTVFEMGTGVTLPLESPIPLRIRTRVSYQRLRCVLGLPMSRWRRGDSNP